MSHFACWTGGVLAGIALTCVGLWIVEAANCCPHPDEDGE